MTHMQPKTFAAGHYSDEHFSLFLVHCCRDQMLLKQACEQVDPMHLKSMGAKTTHVAIFWVVRQFFERYKLAPDHAALMAEFRSYTRRYAQNPEQQKKMAYVFSQFLVFSGRVGDESQRLAYDMLAHIVNDLTIQPQIEDAIRSVGESRNYEGLADQIRRLSAQKAGVGKTRSVTGVTDFEDEPEGQRLPTHLRWFDSRVSSPGPVRGGSMGIIGPSGGGKTTMGINLGIEQALAGQHACLILVEEWSRAVRRKLLACATHIPTIEIERRGDDIERVIHELGLSAELVMAKKKAIDTYLHVMDLTDEGDCQSVRQELQLLKQNNQLPDYAYLDWAGDLADRMVSIDRRWADNKRGAISHIASEMASMAKEFDIFTAVSQQMAADKAEKGPFAKNNQYCAADCHAFTHKQKYCLVLNPRDENTGLQVCRFAKARDDAQPEPFTLRLRGEIARFEDASDKWSVNAGGRIVRSAADIDEHALPEE